MFAVESLLYGAVNLVVGTSLSTPDIVTLLIW